MKSMVFDTGPVISLTVNNLLWLLEPLKKRFGGEFYIPKAVERELITKSLETKRFKFEALQVLEQVNKGVLTIIDKPEIKRNTLHLLELANNCFSAHNNHINILHFTETEALATALHLKSSALVVDERTCRVLVENPRELIKILGKKLHTDININKNNLNAFLKEVRKARLIRSVELITVAYELGLLNRYMARIPEPRKTLLESVLWGVKLNGCAVSDKEIGEILRLEGKK